MTLYIMSTIDNDRCMRRLFRRFLLVSGSTNASLIRTVPSSKLLVIALAHQQTLTRGQGVFLTSDKEIKSFAVGE